MSATACRDGCDTPRAHGDPKRQRWRAQSRSRVRAEETAAIKYDPCSCADELARDAVVGAGEHGRSLAGEVGSHCKDAKPA